MKNSVTYTLKHPLEYPINEKEVKVIGIVSIQRMKVKHLKLIPQEIYQVRDGKRKKGMVDVSKLIPLIAALSGLTEEEMGDVDIEDLPPIVDGVMKIVGEALDRAG